MSRTALVCDDTMFMRTVITEVLTNAGFDVVAEAETGEQSIEMYKKHNPDLVTMDIIMPDIGGIDAVKAIIKHDPAARIIMCSAMNQRALVEESIKAGAKGYIVKPFDPPRLLEEIEKIF